MGDGGVPAAAFRLLGLFAGYLEQPIAHAFGVGFQEYVRFDQDQPVDLHVAE
ncbi:MAG: hypothetical protein QF384_19915 [Alphaproteobacteria bacterium]|nr:hypothetical protein [Alphaproteobacteria bacterium]